MKKTPQIEDILSRLKRPAYILEEAKFRKNLELLKRVEDESGAKILIALKGFAFWSAFKIAAKYLSGVTASGLYEARLGFEEFSRHKKSAQIAVFSPAFSKKEVKKLGRFADHIIFNSFSQMARFREFAGRADIGLRVNPLYSEVSPEIYNSCASGSRLGITPSEFEKKALKHTLRRVSGLHFHTHCEQNSDALERTLGHFERHFGRYFERGSERHLPGLKWVNFGGGHHITREDYDVARLIRVIKDFRERHGLGVFLEPGEAVGWRCGVLVGEVCDIVRNEIDIAVLNVSAAAHMPDCLEMPYTPQIRGAKVVKLDPANLAKSAAANAQNGGFCYRLGGPSCLAGDVIGDYRFEKPLKLGDKLIFEDMIHYTIVKNNTFNGIPLPDLAILRESGELEIVKRFSYGDYKRRNG